MNSSKARPGISLRGRDNFRIDRRKDTVYLSSIFKWFGEDFIESYGTRRRFREHSSKVRAVLNYLKDFVRKDNKQYLLRADYSVDYISYDWSLNEQ